MIKRPDEIEVEKVGVNSKNDEHKGKCLLYKEQ